MNKDNQTSQLWSKVVATYHAQSGERSKISLKGISTLLLKLGFDVTVEKRTHTGPGQKYGKRYFVTDPGKRDFTYLHAKKGDLVIERRYPYHTVSNICFQLMQLNNRQTELSALLIKP